MCVYIYASLSLSIYIYIYTHKDPSCLVLVSVWTPGGQSSKQK